MKSPTAGFENRPLRVLFVRYSSLGDVVFSVDLARSLAERFPLWDLTWLVEAPYAPLVAAQSFVSRVIPWNRREGLGGFLRLIRRIRKEKFDLLVNLQGGDRATFLALASGVPLRYGDHRWLQWVFRQNLYWALGILQVSLFPRRGAYLEAPSVPLPEELEETGHPRIVVAVGASHPRKRWPEPRLRAYLEALRGEASLVLVGSGPEEKRVGEALSRAVPGVLNLVDRLSLEGLVGTLARADLAVAGDTGPLHLARALGRPVLGLWGPTRLSEPYMATLDGEVSCPCPRRGCLDWSCTLPCMETIAVEDVLRETRRILGLRDLETPGP